MTMSDTDCCDDAHNDDNDGDYADDDTNDNNGGDDTYDREEKKAVQKN